MSLLNEAMTSCHMMDRRTVSDGRGGTVQSWVLGAQFDAAVVLDSSMEARVGEAQGVTAVYTVTTNKGVNLQYHDVFVRDEDNKYFRVKSDGDDKKTPASASLNMRQVTAEEWVLANG